MPDTIFCPNCGERISARARFCPSCGARQEEFAVPPVEPLAEVRPRPRRPSGLWSAGGPDAPPPRPPPPRRAPPPREAAARATPPSSRRRADAARRSACPPPTRPPAAPPPASARRRQDAARPLGPTIAAVTARAARRVDPQAADSPGCCGAVALPGIVAAAVAAVDLRRGRARRRSGDRGRHAGQLDPRRGRVDTGLVKETFRQAVGTLLTAMVEEPGLLVSGTRRIHPLLLVAIPLGALIFATRSQLHRTEGASRVARLGWASWSPSRSRC